jgi:hypothetical protein
MAVNWLGEMCLFPFFFGRVEWVGAREALIVFSAFCCASGHPVHFDFCLLMSRFAVRRGEYFFVAAVVSFKNVA